MNKIKAVIIEDEFPAARLLNKMIQKSTSGMGGNSASRNNRRSSKLV